MNLPNAPCNLMFCGIYSVKANVVRKRILLGKSDFYREVYREVI